MSSKIIVVIGATGNQGGSVVDIFLNEPGWTVKGVTRNANSPTAAALTARGVTMVEANLDDSESLIEAFTGAYAIFSVIDFWNGYFIQAPQAKLAPGQTTPEWARDYETQQGRNVLDAAAQTQGLERLIFSALSYVTKWSEGKYKHVYHFDAEGKAVEYGHTQHPDLMKKTSRIQIGMYLTNMLIMPPFWPRKDKDGIYVFETKLPADVKLPMISTNDDTGPLVKRLINAESGKNLLAFREWRTFSDYAEIWGRVMGRKTKYVPLGAEDKWNAMPEELRLDIEESYKYFTEFGFDGGDPTTIHPKDLDSSIELGTVEDWIRKQDWSAVI